jgi:hypothetical protein
MPITDFYSSRQAHEQEPQIDVWLYDQIPQPLRVQISNIILAALGSVDQYSYDNAIQIYEYIRKEVTHEHGRDSLVERPYSTGQAAGDVHICLRTESNVDVWLDIVELSFWCIENTRGNHDEHARETAGITIPAAEAVNELNERFRRAGFGYRYEDGKIYRIDSEFMHQAATRPALLLLSDLRFSGADDEFRAAYDHLKAGEYKDCAVDALNALESTMKVICDAKKLKYQKGTRASDLLKIVRQKKLFPDFLDQSFDQLLATLKSGLPSVRNESGAYGQGATPVDVPEHVAVYALNLAASKIRFLVDAFKASEK